MSDAWKSDPLTMTPEDILSLRADGITRTWLGHYVHYGQHLDGVRHQVVGRVIGARRAHKSWDGEPVRPEFFWVEDVLGKLPITTIATSDMDRIWRHHDRCPLRGCGMTGAEFHSTGPLRDIEWTGLDDRDWPVEPRHVQSTTGTDIAIREKFGRPIAYCEPSGWRVFLGDEEIRGAPADPNSKFIEFPMFVSFSNELRKHHHVEVSRSLAFKLRLVEPLVLP